MEQGKVQCPKCEKTVDRVDGEYARHYTKSELCTMSRRELKDDQPIQG